jgi:hypothetical protein
MGNSVMEITGYLHFLFPEVGVDLRYRTNTNDPGQTSSWTLNGTPVSDETADQIIKGLKSFVGGLESLAKADTILKGLGS